MKKDEWPCSCPCNCGCFPSDPGSGEFDSDDYCLDCSIGRHEVWPHPSDKDIKAIEEWLAQMKQQKGLR